MVGGMYSLSKTRGDERGRASLSAYATASLNIGIAGGTTVESAILRFREQLMDQKHEFSAYIDDAGYIHALGSVGKEGSTQVAPLSAIAKEKGISTLIHNHPFGGSDGGKHGGPLSGGDLRYLVRAYRASGGRIKRMVATSNEGIYSAIVTKTITSKQVDNAIASAEYKLVNGKRFQSEIAMWREVNKVFASEFAKVGVKIIFEEQEMKSARLITQKLGVY